MNTVGATPLAATAMVEQRRKARVTEGQIRGLATLMSSLAPLYERYFARVAFVFPFTTSPFE